MRARVKITPREKARFARSTIPGEKWGTTRSLCVLSLRSMAARGRGGGLVAYRRLMGMCCWMASHFHEWIDYNGVAFSRELLEWGRAFSDFWG